jgi:hypothetical protein
MPGRRRSFRAILTAAVLAAAGGCATTPVSGGLVLRHHSPRENMADAGSVGRFSVANDCVYFDRAEEPAQRIPALFPRGARLSDDRRSIVMPDGRTVRFGESVEVTAEAPPFGQRDETCGANPLEVLRARPATP